MKTLITALLLTIATLFVNAATADEFEPDKLALHNLLIQNTSGEEHAFDFGSREDEEGNLIGVVYYSNGKIASQDSSSSSVEDRVKELIDSSIVASEIYVFFQAFSKADMKVEKVEFVITQLPELSERSIFIVREFSKDDYISFVKETVIVDGKTVRVSDAKKGG